MHNVAENCLQAVDCKMNREMRVKGHDEHGNSVVTFMQQMIPHHLNAIEMSKILLKTASAQEIADVEDLDAHLWGACTKTTKAAVTVLSTNLASY